MYDLKSKLEAQRLQIYKLELSVVEKTMQVDEERATHTRLLALVESNTYDLMTKNKQLSEYANTLTSILKKTQGLENTVSLLIEKLKRKELEWKCLECRMQHEIEDLQSKLAEQLKNIHVAEKHPILVSGNIPTKNSRIKLNRLIGGGSNDKEGSSEDAVDATVSTGLQTTMVARVSNRDIVKHVDGNDHFEDDNIERSNNSSQVCMATPKRSAKPQYVAPHNKSQFRSKNKQLASAWIDTRAHKLHKGPDPHDDFLDTPFDNIMDALIKDKIVGAEVNEINIPNSLHNGSKDANQLMPLVIPNSISTPFAGKRNFKYVETVRKKSEREHLKGIECKQCKKFYDAVLPDDEARKLNSNGGAICEHHQGVSRHRYKHIPPMTPEGFWDIGFDTEM